MSSYRNYQVVLRNDIEVKIQTDDVQLDGEGSQVWFNFLMGEQSVAAIPYDQVRYITS